MGETPAFFCQLLPITWTQQQASMQRFYEQNPLTNPLTNQSRTPCSKARTEVHRDRLRMQIQHQLWCVLKKSYQPAGPCDAVKTGKCRTSPANKWSGEEQRGRQLLGWAQGFAPAQLGSSVQVSSALVYWEHRCSQAHTYTWQHICAPGYPASTCILRERILRCPKWYWHSISLT